MAASDSVNDVSGWLDERLATASPDLLRAMVKQFAEALMSAEADAASRCSRPEPGSTSPDWTRRRRTGGASRTSAPLQGVENEVDEEHPRLLRWDHGVLHRPGGQGL